MFTIEFYETADGTSDIRTFLDELLLKAVSDKNAAIQYKQISRYIQLLEENGPNLPTKVAKKIGKGIWELTPGVNRILFFFYTGDTYVLLHIFRKKTRKTPSREIERAVAEMKDYISRRSL